MATLKRVWMASPNYNSGRSTCRLIVLHSTEGATTKESLGNWFANPSADVSSHVGIDNKDDWAVGEYVKRGNTAWTAGNYNPVAVQAELCCPSGASSNWSRDKWLSQDHMLDKAAQWVKEEAGKFGIPIKALSTNEATSGKWGVCEHKNISGPGGHTDCGPNFPMDEIIRRAKGGTTEDYDMNSNFYLQFKDGGDRADMVFTNEQKSGNYRVRFGCRVTQTLEVDRRDTSDWEGTIGPDGTAGFNIPEGCAWATVHVIPPCDLSVPIAVAIGKS